VASRPREVIRLLGRPDRRAGSAARRMAMADTAGSEEKSATWAYGTMRAWPGDRVQRDESDHVGPAVTRDDPLGGRTPGDDLAERARRFGDGVPPAFAVRRRGPPPAEATQAAGAGVR
jgi:hypothetical protein